MLRRSLLSLRAATVRSFVLALSALHLTHSDTSLENDFGFILIHPLALLFAEGCFVSASERGREGGAAFLVMNRNRKSNDKESIVRWRIEDK